MKLLPMKSNGHAAECICLSCQPRGKEVFGQWDNFRDFIDAMCDTFRPKTAWVYPKFAVLEWSWASDRRKCTDYIEDWSADRFTGVHVDDDDNYHAVIIDVTGEGPKA